MKNSMLQQQTESSVNTFQLTDIYSTMYVNPSTIVMMQAKNEGTLLLLQDGTQINDVRRMPHFRKLTTNHSCFAQVTPQVIVNLDFVQRIDKQNAPKAILHDHLGEIQLNTRQAQQLARTLLTYMSYFVK